MEKIEMFPGGPLLAQIRTPFGRTAVRWCGDRNAACGPYHVEWTVDEDIIWGRNAKPATESTPGVRPGGHCVILRGRLELTVDGAAVFDLGGSLILFDLADRLPRGIDGTWVDLYLEREKISLYPFDL